MMTGDGNRPNILLVMCDQLSALATSPYGNPDVLTPQLDALAARGTTFRRTYCNSPLCAPSRASLMTGRLPDDIPVNDNAEELPSTVPTFAHCLRRVGYTTILSGKMHFIGPDQLHGFEERLTTDVYPSGLQWLPDWEPEGPTARDMGDMGGASTGRVSLMQIPESGPVPWSFQLDYDEEVHFRALERIRQLSRRQTDSGSEPDPWLLCVSYTQPHNPFAPAQEYWDRYEGHEIGLPTPTPPDHQETVWDTWVNAYNGVDRVEIGEEDIRRARRSYYAMISYIDDKLGELQRELERFGQLDHTVVVFLSDHGDMMGEHGMFFKRTFREWSSRVPLIFAGPGIPSGVFDQPVSLVDLFPTLLGLAGAEQQDASILDELAGHDLLSTASGSAEPGPVLIDYNAEGTLAATRTVVRGTWKYVHVHGQPESLFDLAADPEEWTDLAGDPRHSAVLAELRELCLKDWDPAEAHERILTSQRRRRALGAALATGTQQSWDYQPVFDASRQYVRRPAAAPSSDPGLVTRIADPLAGGG